MLEQDQCDLLDFLLEESGRPVTFIALFDRDDIPEAVRDTLRRCAPQVAKGARPQTSPLPLTREVDMKNPFAFAAFPAWKRVFADTNPEAQKKVYADPAFRNEFRENLKNPTGFSNWGRIGVYAVKNPALKSLEGKSVAQIAQEQGKDGVDAFLDLVLADNLECELTMASWNTREDRMRELLNNKSILMALGDGGAHVDMLCDAGYPTYLLGTWVREKEVLTLEEGVRRLTSDPADLFGLKDRGRLTKGAPADVAIFDAGAIGSSNHGERRYDLPGGAKRIVMPSRGVEYTIVNGAVTWEQGQLPVEGGHGAQGLIFPRRKVQGGWGMSKTEGDVVEASPSVAPRHPLRESCAVDGDCCHGDDRDRTADRRRACARDGRLQPRRRARGRRWAIAGRSASAPTQTAAGNSGSYWTHGFYVFQGVVGDEELAELRAAVDRVLARAPVAPDAKLDRFGRKALGEGIIKPPYRIARPA